MNKSRIFELLEDKHNNISQPTSVLIDEALNSSEFTEQWLCHAVSCSLNIEEIAVVLIIAHRHDLPVYHELAELWPIAAQPSEKEKSVFYRILNEFFSEINIPKHNDIALLWRNLVVQQSYECTLSGKVTTHMSKLNKDLSDQLVDYAKSKLEPAKVYSHERSSERLSRVRDNDQFVVDILSGNILIAVMQRLMCMHNLAQLPFAEPPIFYRYRDGQQYKWHCDYIIPRSDSVKQELRFFGQRIATTILNLTDQFSGGETEFKNWKISISAKVGQLIQFFSFENGKPNPDSVHAGLPVYSGDKWVCTLWFRQRPYWLRRSIWATKNR
jgi:prolyl 4-hydroxylase